MHKGLKKKKVYVWFIDSVLEKAYIKALILSFGMYLTRDKEDGRCDNDRGQEQPGSWSPKKQIKIHAYLQKMDVDVCIRPKAASSAYMHNHV